MSQSSILQKILALNNLWLLKAIQMNVAHEEGSKEGGNHRYVRRDDEGDHYVYWYQHSTPSGGTYMSKVTSKKAGGEGGTRGDYKPDDPSTASWQHEGGGAQIKWGDLQDKFSNLAHSVLSHYHENREDIHASEQPKSNLQKNAYVVNNIPDYKINEEDTMNIVSNMMNKQYKNFDDFVANNKQLLHVIQQKAMNLLTQKAGGMKPQELRNYVEEVEPYVYLTLQRVAKQIQDGKIEPLDEQSLTGRLVIETPKKIFSRWASGVKELKVNPWELDRPMEGGETLGSVTPSNAPTPESALLSKEKHEYIGKIDKEIKSLTDDESNPQWNSIVMKDSNRRRGDVFRDIVRTNQKEAHPEDRGAWIDAANQVAQEHFKQDGGIDWDNQGNAPRNLNAYYQAYRFMVDRDLDKYIGDIQRRLGLNKTFGMLMLANSSLLLKALSISQPMSKMDDFQSEKWLSAVHITRRSFGDEMTPGFLDVVNNTYKKLTWDKGNPLPIDATYLVRLNPFIPIPDPLSEENLFNTPGNKKIIEAVDIEPI